MATTIKLKNGSGAPLAGDLVQGEPALDLTNKRLYTEDSGGTVIEVGTNPTSLTTGTFTSTGIDDNASSTAITIDSSENVSISPSGGIITLGANGHLTSKQSLDVATAGGRYIGASNRGTVGQIRIEQTTTSADGGYVSFDTCASGSTSPTERMRINSSGAVGIGVVPDSFNTVDGALQVGTRNTLTSFSNDIGIGYNHYYNSGWKYANTDVASRFSSTSSIPFLWQYAASGSADAAITWSEAMRIDSSGNVGIGTATTTAIRLTSVTPTANHIAAQIENSNTADSFGLVVKGGNDANDYAADFRKRDNTNIMRIRGDGNVGIGTTSPSSKLSVSDASTTWAAQIHNTNGTDGAGLFIRSDSTNDPMVLGVYGNGSYRMVARADGKVGIGSGASGSLSTTLEVSGDSSGVTNNITTYNASTSSTAEASVDWSLERTGSAAKIRAARISAGKEQSWTTTASTVDGYMRFLTVRDESLNEAMRIDSNGVVLVGKTSFNYTSEGIAIEPDRISGVRNGTIAIWVRNTSDGEIFQFRKDTTTVGAINTYFNDIAFGNGDTGLLFNSGSDQITPFNIGTNAARDNAIDLGASGTRFDDIYATNGTIQTSDINEKQDIETLSEAEQRVAVAAKALLRKFRWKSAVRTKSHDARIHFGIIAQDLQAAFEAEGLDAGEYGMFINTTWTDEETGEERSRMGVRYSELLAFIIAAI